MRFRVFLASAALLGALCSTAPATAASFSFEFNPGYGGGPCQRVYTDDGWACIPVYQVPQLYIGPDYDRHHRHHRRDHRRRHHRHHNDY